MTHVGGVPLPHPIIVAAGMVKGDDLIDESFGAVDMGSFTRYPRTGNRSRVVWLDHATSSIQNRVGLHNQGVVAASISLSSKRRILPAIWGVNLAISPGLDDIEKVVDDIDASVSIFVRAFVGHPRPPAWYTLNLSCPNTEDDPESFQTDEFARRLGTILVDRVEGTPVWMKVGPGLSNEQYRTLVYAFAETGVRAVIATNSMTSTAPNSDIRTGLSGSGLRVHALKAVTRLSETIHDSGLDLDIIACGGIIHGDDLVAAIRAGAKAAMIYSALVFRGPSASTLILDESGYHRPQTLSKVTL